MPLYLAALAISLIVGGVVANVVRKAAKRDAKLIETFKVSDTVEDGEITRGYIDQ